MSEMSSKLEQVLEYLVNGEQDKAETLLHDVIVEKARGIHEELVNAQEDTVAEETTEEATESTEATDESTEVTEESKDEDAKEEATTEAKEEDSKEETDNTIGLSIKKTITGGKSNQADKKNYNSTKNYKPSGKLVYNDDLIDLLGNKFT